MTVASEIARIKTNISNAYDSAEAKGATLPEQKNSENLAECIDSITGGSSETPVTLIKFADDVTVATNENEQQIIFPPFCPIKIDFNNLEIIEGEGVFYYSIQTPYTVSIVAKKIRICSGDYCFYGLCTGTVFDEFEFDFSSIEEISGEGAFQNAFLNCKNIPSVIRFTNLHTLTGEEAFLGIFSGDVVSDIYFNSLTSNSFDGEKSVFTGLLYRVSGCTIHLPSNLSTIMPTMDEYPSFSGTNTTLLFDLPPTA